jgi:hypothetical protein
MSISIIDARRPALVTAAGFKRTMNCHQSLHLRAAKKMRQKKLWKIVDEQQLVSGSLEPGVGYGVTVTLNAAEWLVAEVAVTVTLEVPGGVPIFGGGVLLPPPQLTRQKASAVAPNVRDQRQTFLLRLPILTTNSPNTIATGHAAKVQGFRPAIGTAAELGAVVVMVSVVDTGLPPGVRLAGEKLQLEAAGNPLQANMMEEFKPLTGLTVMVNVVV